MSIRVKILSLAGGLVLLLLLSNAATYVALNRMHADGLQINLGGRQRMLSQRMAKEALLLASVDSAGEAQAREQLERSVSLFDSTLTSLRDGGETLDGEMRPCVLPAAVDPGVRAALDRGVAAWEPLRQQLSGLAAGRLTPGSPQAVEAVEAMVVGSAPLMGAMNEITGAFQAASDAKRVTLYSIQALTLLLAAGLFGVVCWALQRVLFRPLAVLQASVARIAEGDLTQHIAVKRRDEIGALAEGVNQMAGRMAEVIRNVIASAGEVASAATQIAASSEQVAGGMKEQTSQITQVSAAVEQMSASVMEVARKSGEASGSATQSGDVATRGGEVVEATIQRMTGISEAVQRSAGAVQDLGRRGEQIGAVIAVINDIAEQTNLLALNAAIEAARAGEHGRGFAVVADEVRKLADRTTRATEEIAESITAIQSETRDAVHVMNANTEQVEMGVSQAREAGDALRQIVASARDVAGMIQSIAAAAEQQSAAAEEVSSSVVSISAMTRQASDGSVQSAAAAGQLSVKSEELLRLVRMFRTEAAAAPTAEHAR